MQDVIPAFLFYLWSCLSVAAITIFNAAGLLSEIHNSILIFCVMLCIIKLGEKNEPDY